MSDHLQTAQESSPCAGADAVYLREIICEIVGRESVKVFAKRIEAIILTGSLARDEATFVRRGDSWELFGDAEFMLVLEENGSSSLDYRPLASSRVAGSLDVVSQRIAKNLSERNIRCAIDLKPVDRNYFRHLPRHIFSYELKTCGKVIWGDGRILQAIPHVSPDDLSREDAWRLLCNRLIEVLAFVEEFLNKDGRLAPRVYYATVKLYLDIATSYLVFAAAYVPTYRGRAERLRILAERRSTDADVPFPLEDFSRRVTKCTEWKLSGSDVPPVPPKEFWLEAIALARQLWRWEVIQMTKTSLDLPMGALWDQMEQQLRFAEKVRGWASAARRSGGLRSWRHWPRWALLGLRATPRYLVYRAGTELVFRLPDLVADAERAIPHQEWGKLEALLPLTVIRPVDGLASWQVLADQIVSCYRELITSTRA